MSDDDEEELDGVSKEKKDKEKDSDDTKVEERRKRMRDDAKAALYKERKDSAVPMKLGVFLYDVPAEEAKSQVRRLLQLHAHSAVVFTRFSQALLKEFAVVLLEPAPIKRTRVCSSVLLTWRLNRMQWTRRQRSPSRRPSRS